MCATDLDATQESGERVRDAMGDQLAVYVEVVFLDSGSKSGNVDGHMYDAEERESKHGRDRANQSGPINAAKFCNVVSVSD
jgi:hypothetical protein